MGSLPFRLTVGLVSMGSCTWSMHALRQIKHYMYAHMQSCKAMHGDSNETGVTSR